MFSEYAADAVTVIFNRSQTINGFIAYAGTDRDYNGRPWIRRCSMYTSAAGFEPSMRGTMAWVLLVAIALSPHSSPRSLPRGHFTNRKKESEYGYDQHTQIACGSPKRRRRSWRGLSPACHPEFSVVYPIRGCLLFFQGHGNMKDGLRSF
jgi:hypothetical protein